MARKGKSSIEGLNETLNSRTRYKNPLDERNPVRELNPRARETEVGEKWQSEELDEMLKRERVAPKINSFMKKVFIFALLFFLAAIVVAGFVFYKGSTFVSSKNVDVAVLGPTTISAGEVLELGVSISNTNNADLEIANLSIQFPEGSRDPLNNSAPLSYTKEDLGIVKAGAEATRDIRMILLGSAGEVREVKFSVEYKVKGSNATFYKDKIFSVTIGEAPITLEVESPESVTSGDTFTTVVSVTLNSTEVLRDVILKAEYPYGFSVIDDTPGVVTDDNIWVLGDLSPGDKKKISIRGRLIGENEEERTFRFYVGVSDSSSASPDLKITIVSQLNTIAIERPSLDLAIKFNGENTRVYMAPAAREISTTINFENNLPETLLNPWLEVVLSGVALDTSAVNAGGSGFFDVTNSRVVWNFINNQGISELAPGENGEVTFRFASLPAPSLPSGPSDINLRFTLTGVPVGAVGQIPLTVSETRTVKISSQINFSSRILRSLGSFVNYGPIPPKVGETSAYTVVFSVVNTQNDIADARVSAKLGPAVGWLAAQSIAGENITYNSLTNTVSWDLGTLSSETGFSSAPRELSFQISLTPTVGQIGTAPTLVNSIVFSGRDTQTGNAITVNNPPLTTRLAADPAFIQGDDIVVNNE